MTGGATQNGQVDTHRLPDFGNTIGLTIEDNRPNYQQPGVATAVQHGGTAVQQGGTAVQHGSTSKKMLETMLVIFEPTHISEKRFKPFTL